MKHSPSQVKELIQRFQNGQCTPEELKLLQQWVAQLDLSDEAAATDATQLQSIKEQMYRQITARVVPLHRKTARRRYIAAAGWLVLIASSILLWYTFQRTGSQQKRRVLLTTIVNNENLVKRITLPDGTTVCLNRNSRLEFDAQQYNHDQRFVTLTGEGFFEVTEDPGRPFVVETGNLRTRVLGTAFNIEAYQQESEIRVSLVNGKIALDDTATAQSTLLAPDQTLRYSKHSRTWELLPVEAQRVALWTQGWLVFNELPLQEALARIGERYNLAIEYKPELLHNKRITAGFKPGPWAFALENVLFVHGLHYTMSGSKIIITK